jgi:serine/threonine-protein kinase RsbW
MGLSSHVDRFIAMAPPPNVCLNLSNRPENVLLVREMLTGVAQAIELDGNELYDIRTAVTEACNNVVLHAYEGEEGPLEVELYVSGEAIEVVVRDHGVGIRPRIRDPDETALGIGLPLIQALVHSVEFTEPDDRGTEIRMQFHTPPTRALEPVKESAAPVSLGTGDPATTTEMTLAPSALARRVFPRVLIALAARAHFSTDRISDAQLVADAVAASAPRSVGQDHLSIAVTVEPRSLRLCVGPLGVGHADEMMRDSAVDGLGPVIEKLADEHRVAPIDAGEMLALQLSD